MNRTLRNLVIAGVVGLAVAASASVASAAPSMVIDRVTSPTGEWNTDGATTWHVGVDLGAWDTAACGGTAVYANGDTRDGEDQDPDGGTAESWNFAADVPGQWNDPPVNGSYYNFVPLSRVTASCDLERSVYAGRRSYRRRVEFSKYAPATVSRHRGGCSIYSYSSGELTIDCRHSRSSGSATWMFAGRRTDRNIRYGDWFDRSQSTMGAHDVSAHVKGKRLFVTETVSPGTMITVTEVWASYSRLFWRKVYRHYARTITGAWYPG